MRDAGRSGTTRVAATHRNGIGSFVVISRATHSGASRCRIYERVSSRLERKDANAAVLTRRDARRVVRGDSKNYFFPRDSARLSSPSRVASSLEPNEPNRTERTEPTIDRWMALIPRSRRFSRRRSSTRRRRENGAFAHGSRSALRLYDVSSAPRSWCRFEADGYRALRTPRLPGRASRRSDDDDRSV